MELSSLTDENLLAGYCRTGREEMFEELVRRYWDRLLGWALNVIRDYSTAQDVRQLALLKVLEKCHQFKGDSSVSTWLFAIVRNLAVNVMRKRKMRKYRTIWCLPIESASVDRLSYLDRQYEEPIDVRAMIDELSPKLRTIATMRFIDGEPYDVIAKRLGLPMGTVRSSLHRAKAIIAQRPEFANQE